MSEERKRCFIAIDLPREAIAVIKYFQEIIKKKNLFTGKFTEPENLHLTLKFLGEIDDDKIEEIKKRLGEIKFNNFEASLGEIGVFSKRVVRIVWVKLNNGKSGSITFIGTVSPAGGNLKEPVTESTKKAARAFYALAQHRADSKRYPAIDPIDSYSKYLEYAEVVEYMDENIER